MARVWLGTSGFSYPHWRRILYPEGLPQARWLERYAEVFSTVELNTTFYRLPKPGSVERWRDETPRGFLFACKGSRFLTHVKRLKDAGGGLEKFFGAVERLGPKLGPVLWQLPPQMAVDLERLESFLAQLPKRHRHAVEFRSPDWYTGEVCSLLERYGAAFCEHDLVDRAPPGHTGGWRYLRFHGTTGRYSGRYGRAALSQVARDLDAWRADGRDAYAYFNNDTAGHAVMDAIALSELLGEPRPLGGEAARAST